MRHDAVLAETLGIHGHDDDLVEAYTARPMTATNRGGMIVIHHMPGYDRGSKEIVGRFATLGNDAICPNLYWRDAPGASPDDAPADDASARPRIIGDLTLVLSSIKHRRATIGWVLNPQFQGKGYAAEAASRVLTLAFDEVGSHRVVAELDPRNTASASLCTRLGMRLEGHFVHSGIVEGEWADLAVYAILDVEWNARNALDG